MAELGGSHISHVIGIYTLASFGTNIAAFSSSVLCINIVIFSYLVSLKKAIDELKYTLLKRCEDSTMIDRYIGINFLFILIFILNCL